MFFYSMSLVGMSSHCLNCLGKTVAQAYIASDIAMM